jgi:hypothetical protein
MVKQSQACPNSGGEIMKTTLSNMPLFVFYKLINGKKLHACMFKKEKLSDVVFLLITKLGLNDCIDTDSNGCYSIPNVMIPLAMQKAKETGLINQTAWAQS